MTEFSIPQYRRTTRQRYALVGEKCEDGHVVFPPRDICPEEKCGQPAHQEYQLSGKGEVYSYTTVYEAPVGFEAQVPYVIAMVELAEGPLVTAQLTDIDNREVEIGMSVEMVTRKLRDSGGERGLVVYGYKFRPILGSE